MDFLVETEKFLSFYLVNYLGKEITENLINSWSE